MWANINLLDRVILDNWVIENFRLADVYISETCVLINDSLCGKLVSSFELPNKSDEGFIVTSVPVFIADLRHYIFSDFLLSCELDNFWI